jgi:DNA ligase (NAD+)
VEGGLVSKVTDLLDLRNNVTATFIEEIGNKVVENLLAEIDRAKERVHIPERVIAGLSISGVGQETARKILADIGGMHQCYALGTLCASGLLRKEIVDAICASGEDIAVVYASLKFPEVVVSKDLPPERMVIAITGDLSGVTRQEYADSLAQKGIRVASSVVKKCSYLVCDNPSQSSKTKRAAKLGVPVVSRAEFDKVVAGY